jgi:hypothetical protein
MLICGIQDLLRNFPPSATPPDQKTSVRQAVFRAIA